MRYALALCLAGGQDHAEKLGDFYKWKSISGGSEVDGDVQKLFPYMRSNGKYMYMYEPESGQRKSMWCNTSSFPSGESQAPFMWKVAGNEPKPMVFRAFPVPIQSPEDGTISVKSVIHVADAADLKKNDHSPKRTRDMF